MTESALYIGEVKHVRHRPKVHRFSYRIFLFWLDLENVQAVCDSTSGMSVSSWSLVQFRRSDYLGDPTVPLHRAVLKRMSELAQQPLDGKVFLLGQLRTFGLYFSPVNFYYLQQQDGSYSHLLAEVSNTPWNERHHYLVDLTNQQDCDKAFHVSPFNPMDMQYHWRVQQPAEQLNLTLGCSQQKRHFDASLHLTRRKLNSKQLLRVLLSIPSMTIKTVVGIYWQALKLYIKGVPVYGHSDNKENDTK